MRKLFFVLLSIGLFLLPINIFSKNAANKPFASSELTITTEEKLLQQVKHKLVQYNSNYNLIVFLLTCKSCQEKTGFIYDLKTM
jgi:hypothetical protein